MTSARRANLAGIVGRAIYRHNKGSVYVQPLKGWLLTALGGSAALKYLGLDGGMAVGLMLAIAVVTEGLAVTFGWLEHRIGATAEHYKTAAETDIYKRESLELLREIRDGFSKAKITVIAKPGKLPDMEWD